MQKSLAVMLVSVIAAASPAAAQDESNGLAVTPDAQNIVANSLMGTWRVDAPLNKRLGHRGGDKTITFSSNPGVVKDIPAKLATKLRGGRIFGAGTMLRGSKKNAFLVTELKGNPTIVWFRESKGEQMGAAESWNVSLVRAKHRADDLMFLGGDFNNQGVAAYARESGELGPAAALTEMVRLLEAGLVRRCFETCVEPVYLAKLAKDSGSMDLLVKSQKGERLQDLIDLLTAASKRFPELRADGKEATWKVGKEPDPIRLLLIKGRWYLCGR